MHGTGGETSESATTLLRALHQHFANCHDIKRRAFLPSPYDRRRSVRDVYRI